MAIRPLYYSSLNGRGSFFPLFAAGLDTTRYLRARGLRSAPAYPPHRPFGSRLDYPLRPSPLLRAAHSVDGAILHAVELVPRLRLFRRSRAGPGRYRRTRAQFVSARRPQFLMGRCSAGSGAACLGCSSRQRWALAPPWARRPRTCVLRVSAPVLLAGGSFASGVPVLGGPDLPLKPLPSRVFVFEQSGPTS